MNKRIRGQNKIRVAKYKRVSTDEQKLKKNSIIAQDEILNEYIEKDPNLVLVGDFSDEGVSGTKLLRTELESLLNMVENGEVDLILITKLDRWFRNVGFYYKVQEILDRNGVAWKTVLEDYDTTTASGKLNINIALTLAQHETDKTSDRIKVVFESKIKHKQAITGAQPFGFKVVDGNGAKMVVHDPETKIIVKDMIDYAMATHSIRATMIYINEKYDHDISYNTIYRLLRNPILYGHYAGVDDYCEPYISKSEWESLQKGTSRNIRQRETKRIYIFSGLLICPHCGRRMSGVYVITKKKNSSNRYTYQRYRCDHHIRDVDCDFKKTIGETALETKLLEQVLPQFENLIMSVDIEEKKQGPRINKAAIKEEMERLNKMYQKGRIDEDEYDRKYDALEKKLFIKEKPKKDYSKIKEILNQDFKTLYKTFNDKEKQMFWRSIVDTIEFEGDDIIINFL